MIKIYLTKNGETNLIDEPKPNCWINMVHPTEEELTKISSLYNIDIDDMKAPLDDEESSRMVVEDDYTLVLVDIPTTEERNGKNRYVTIPLGIFVTDSALITVCLEKTPVLDIAATKKNDFNTRLRTRLLLRVLLNNAKLYLKYLKTIYKQSGQVERQLQVSTENSSLLDMMELSKSLIYFNTSLKPTTLIIEKMFKSKSINKYEEDEDLLEDVQNEYRQAIETTEIYSGILGNLMDAYASIIANNMNVVMKVLAIATIVLSIPNIVFGAFGMNLTVMPLTNLPGAFWIIVVISIAAALGFLYYFNHKKLF